MHFTTRRFWESYNVLPEEVQRTADQCYELLKSDPSHPSLHFKKVGKYWSVGAGRNYRALGIEVMEAFLQKRSPFRRMTKERRVANTAGIAIFLFSRS